MCIKGIHYDLMRTFYTVDLEKKPNIKESKFSFTKHQQGLPLAHRFSKVDHQ